MPTFTPNSTLELFKGIPLDLQYKNTIYWRDRTAQENAFFNHASRIRYSNYSYIRNNTVRVDGKIGDLYNVNYLRFKNTDYLNRWFYAFVTNVAYVNENVCAITYEIDILQTWLLDVTILPSYVERETPASDALFSNLVDEGQEYGDYILKNEYTIPEFAATNLYPLVGVSRYINQNGGFSIRSSFVYGLPSYITYYVMRTHAQLYEFYNYYRSHGNTDDIIEMTVVPGPFLRQQDFEADSQGFYYLKEDLTSADVPEVRTSIPAIAIGDTFQSYRPRNNKLYNNPYMRIVVTDLQGNTSEYLQNFFAVTANAQQGLQANRYYWAIKIALNSVPQPMICPMRYKTANLYNWTEMLVGAPFSQQPLVTDTYRAWLAMNSSQISNQRNILNSTAAHTLASGAYNTETAALALQQARNNTLQGKADRLNELAKGAIQKSGEYSPDTTAVDPQSAGAAQFLYDQQHYQDYNLMGKLGALTSALMTAAITPGNPINAGLNAGAQALASGVQSVTGRTAGASQQARKLASDAIAAARDLETEFTAAGQAAAMAERAFGLQQLTERYNNEQAQLAIQGLNAKISDAQMMSPGVRGTNNPNLMAMYDFKGFRIYKFCITDAFARIIDDYFDRFGYAIHRRKAITFENRSYWTYIKTVNAQVFGGVDAQVRSQIVTILDSGVTFWRGSSGGFGIVGHYELDNRDPNNSYNP